MVVYTQKLRQIRLSKLVEMQEPNYSEIDLTLAIQLQAQFEEELRVQHEKEEEKLKSLQITGL